MTNDSSTTIGRPALPDEAKRDQPVMAMFTKSERAQIDAARYQQSLSSWIREAVLERLERES